MGKQKHRHREKSKKIRVAGKIALALQVVFSVVLVMLIWNSGMVPIKYLIALVVALLIPIGLVAFLQYKRGKARTVGIILSIIFSIIIAFGCLAFHKVVRTMVDFGGANYKTNNMIVVVKESNPAQNLFDAKDYRFGTQTMMDEENTALMIDDIQNSIGREMKIEQYGSLIEEAEALLSGKVEAAIYNEAFTTILEENIEDYSSKVRIIYQYGIDVEVEVEPEIEKGVLKPFNVYISGIDVAGDISKNSRSDVNIIMTVNPETKQILLTTTPRDYYVQIPNISGEQRDKLTHAGIYGVDVSMNTLGNLYGIDIAYYARVNFTSLIRIIDTLGGVTVNSNYDFSAGGYHFVKGPNFLNGEQALAFSRERYSFEDGDNQRGKNQQLVLTAILQKAMSPAIINSAPQLIGMVSDCIQTNMTQDEMSQLINMQLNDMADWTIESVAATGTGDTQSCFSSGSQPLYVMWPDEAVVGDISRRMQQILTATK